MYCSNCGNILSQNDKFCGKCGIKIENTIIENNSNEEKDVNPQVVEPVEEKDALKQGVAETPSVPEADPVLKIEEEKPDKEEKAEKADLNQKLSSILKSKKIIPAVILCIVLIASIILYSIDILRLDSQFPFIGFYTDGSMHIPQNKDQVKKFYEIKRDLLVKAVENKDNQSIIKEYHDISIINKKISDTLSQPSNEKEQDLIREFENQMQILSQIIEKYGVEIISTFINAGDSEKIFLGEIFQNDMIRGENGKKLVEIMANFYAQNNEVENLNSILRTAISVYGNEGIEIVNVLQQKLYTEYKDLPKAWSYLNTPSYDMVMNAEDGYFKVANYIQGELLWGLVDSTGQEIVTPQYQLLGNFLEDRAAVKKNGKWGFIDKSGNVVINFQFDDLKEPNDLTFYQHAIRNPENVSRGFYNGFAGVSIGNKWGFVDKNGKPLGPGIIFKEVQNFSEGSAPVTMDGEKYGLLSADGSYIIAPNEYSYLNGITFGVIRPIFEGLAGVNWDNYNERGLVNKYGQLVHVFDRSQRVTLVQDFREGLSSFRQKNDYTGKSHWGFIDRSGRIVISAVYDSVSIFINGISIVQKNGQYGLINREGNQILPISYDKITRFNNGFVKVYKNGRMALANTQGQVITDFKYEDVGSFKQEMSYYIQDGKYGLINSVGKEVLPPVYRTISTFNNGLAPALKQEKWGYIDSSGFFVIEPVFDKIIAFDNGISAVQQDGKFRFIKINAISSSVVGQVIGENTQPISDAQISIYKLGDSKIYASAGTNSNGQYQIMLPEANYKFVIEKEGYLNSSIYINLDGEENYNIERVILISEQSAESEKAQVKIKTGESLTGTGLSNVKVKFRSGYNNKDGGYIKDAGGSDIVVNTDDSGYFTIMLPVGLYTAETNIEGYSATYINFAVSSKIDYSSLDRNIPITRKLDTNQIRITLEWGSFPNDLDSHLFGNLSDGYTPFHVYYPTKENEEGSAKLDKDDTQGNGFETTTIYNLNSGTYYYDVFDFSDQLDYYSSIMSNSGAKVKVWRGSEAIAVFDVPSNKIGNVWRVFQIRDNRIIPINVIENSYNVDEYVY